MIRTEENIYRLYAHSECEMNSVLEMVSGRYAIQIHLLTYVNGTRNVRQYLVGSEFDEFHILHAFASRSVQLRVFHLGSLLPTTNR